MKGILHMNVYIFLCVHLHRHTHKTCSKHLWLNYWICFDHDILHKPSKTPLEELEWSCLSCVRGNSAWQRQLPRPVPAAFVPRRGAVPGGKGHPGLEPWPGTALPLGIGAVPWGHTCGLRASRGPALCWDCSSSSVIEFILCTHKHGQGFPCSISQHILLK